MTDLAEQILERLECWAPVHGDGPPPSFIESAALDECSPEQIERWHHTWGKLLGGSAELPVRILPAGPRVYPGFEQMRDALIAVLELHQCVEGIGFTGDAPGDYGTVKKACSACGKVDEYAVKWPCGHLYVIAKALGIEATA